MAVMLELSRTVRFCLSDPTTADAVGAPRATPRHNTFASWPAMRGLGRYYELAVRCRGEADPDTGCIINVKCIDQAVRDHVLPYLEDLLAHSARPARAPLGDLMRRLITLLQPALGGRVVQVQFQFTPTYRLQIRSRAMDHVILKQQYDFSAAHRLHIETLSDEENHRIFGKCNNLAGHGHNYRVEVAVRVVIDHTGSTLDVEEIDAIVAANVIEKLDHKHLNTDVSQFAKLNPSVENIAKVVWTMLDAPLSRLDTATPAQLEAVSVWETEKTVCTYLGPRTADDEIGAVRAAACR